MAISFVGRLPRGGLDIKETPPWQMVPLGEQRVLMLRGAGQLVPYSLDPSIAAVGLNGAGDLVVQGRKRGQTSVVWGPRAGAAPAKTPGFVLDVSVKARVNRVTAFHYVTDGRRQTTRRNMAHLDGIVGEANSIVQPQANAAIVSLVASRLAIADDLGSVVGGLKSAAWRAIVAHARSDAGWNVFFVREVEGADLQHDEHAITAVPQNNTLFEDRIENRAAVTLAHELLHVLGQHDHSTNPRHLIAPAYARRGLLISRKQVDLVNPDDP